MTDLNDFAFDYDRSDATQWVTNIDTLILPPTFYAGGITEIPLKPERGSIWFEESPLEKRVKALEHKVEALSRALKFSENAFLDLLDGEE